MTNEQELWQAIFDQVTDGKTRLKLYRGLEKHKDAFATVDGALYFAYDSGNIYLSKNNRYYAMGSGSSSGISYAHGTAAEIIKAEPEDESSFVYQMPISVLDDNSVMLHADTLILNSDGRFFRVNSVDEINNLIYATLLVVSGTGGGGSGVIYSDRSKMGKIDPESKYFINGQSAKITVWGFSGKDFDGSLLDRKLTVFWELYEKSETGSLIKYAKGDFVIDASVENEDESTWTKVDFDFGTQAHYSTTSVLKMWVDGTYSTTSRALEYEF